MYDVWDTFRLQCLGIKNLLNRLQMLGCWIFGHDFWQGTRQVQDRHSRDCNLVNVGTRVREDRKTGCFERGILSVGILGCLAMGRTELMFVRVLSILGQWCQ